jgi:hypothetical protein
MCLSKGGGEDLLLLFAALLLCLRLLRFLGHVALRDPKKLVQCKSSIDMHLQEYTTIAKLIRQLAKKVNDGHSLATFRFGQALDAWTRARKAQLENIRLILT